MTIVETRSTQYGVDVYFENGRVLHVNAPYPESILLSVEFARTDHERNQTMVVEKTAANLARISWEDKK